MVVYIHYKRPSHVIACAARARAIDTLFLREISRYSVRARAYVRGWPGPVSTTPSSAAQTGCLGSAPTSTSALRWRCCGCNLNPVYFIHFDAESTMMVRVWRCACVCVCVSVRVCVRSVAV